MIHPPPKKKQQQQQPIMLQQYLICIDARLRSRNSTVFVMAETAEYLVAPAWFPGLAMLASLPSVREPGDQATGCTRLNYRVMLI